MNTQTSQRIFYVARKRLMEIIPGVLLCLLLTLLAEGIQYLEQRYLGREWLEALVVAIILGAGVRFVWTPDRRWENGIQFSAKVLLETAVVLLGAGISIAMIREAGWAMLSGIAVVVALAIVISYGLGRLFGLPARMATLIACGNAICGNSAIAAVAPVIDAKSEDVAAAIAFTAVLGVGVVLGLPYLAWGAGMSAHDFGVFAGLTVYAVPQVLAATAPISSVSAQVGMLVKLVRVLMLGPVIVVLSFSIRYVARQRIRALRETGEGGLSCSAIRHRAAPGLHHLLPWFIVGFLLMIGLRSAGVIPEAMLKPMGQTAHILTVLSMAGLGLGVDVRTVSKAGPRVTTVVVLSLLALGAIAWGMVKGLSLV